MQVTGMSRLFTALFGCYLFLVLAFGGSEKESPMDPPLCEMYDVKVGVPDSTSEPFELTPYPMMNDALWEEKAADFLCH